MCPKCWMAYTVSARKNCMSLYMRFAYTSYYRWYREPILPAECVARYSMPVKHISSTAAKWYQRSVRDWSQSLRGSHSMVVGLLGVLRLIYWEHADLRFAWAEPEISPTRGTRLGAKVEAKSRMGGALYSGNSLLPVKPPETHISELDRRFSRLLRVGLAVLLALAEQKVLYVWVEGQAFPYIARISLHARISWDIFHSLTARNLYDMTVSWFWGFTVLRAPRPGRYVLDWPGWYVSLDSFKCWHLLHVICATAPEEASFAGLYCSG